MSNPSEAPSISNAFDYRAINGPSSPPPSPSWFSATLPYRHGHRYGMDELRNSIPWPTPQTKERVLRHCDKVERSHKISLAFSGIFSLSVIAFVVAQTQCHRKHCDDAIVVLRILCLMIYGTIPAMWIAGSLHSRDRDPLRKELERVPVNGVYRGRLAVKDAAQSQSSSTPTDAPRERFLGATYRLEFRPNLNDSVNDGVPSWNIVGSGTFVDHFAVASRVVQVRGALQGSGQASWEETAATDIGTGDTATTLRTGWFVLARKSYSQQTDDLERSTSPGSLQLELHRALWGRRANRSVGFGPAQDFLFS